MGKKLTYVPLTSVTGICFGFFFSWASATCALYTKGWIVLKSWPAACLLWCIVKALSWLPKHSFGGTKCSIAWLYTASSKCWWMRGGQDSFQELVVGSHNRYFSLLGRLTHLPSATFPFKKWLSVLTSGSYCSVAVQRGFLSYFLWSGCVCTPNGVTGQCAWCFMNPASFCVHHWHSQLSSGYFNGLIKRSFSCKCTV